jgi:rhodanese-related sulfurtransferase
VRGIKAREAAEKIESGDAFVLDVRERQEWEAGHIPQATHISHAEIKARLTEIPKDREVIVVCRSGNRSGHVGKELRDVGYDVLNLEGGMRAWHELRLAMEPAHGRVA